MDDFAPPGEQLTMSGDILFVVTMEGVYYIWWVRPGMLLNGLMQDSAPQTVLWSKMLIVL